MKSGEVDSIYVYMYISFMTNLVKTTINIPADLLEEAKQYALQNKTSLSKLITLGLKNSIKELNKYQEVDPMTTLGKYRIGIKNIYNKRSELYESTR